MSYNDPTGLNPERQQQLEPTQPSVPVYTSYSYDAYPYSPYAPPPPQKKSKKLMLIFAFVGITVVVLNGIIIAVLLLRQSSASASIPPTSTIAPTQVPAMHPTIVTTVVSTTITTIKTTVIVPTSPSQVTQVPQISYSADDVYSAFSQAGISMGDPKNDTNWRCCTYFPEGGALVWTDLSAGLAVDIATFESASEADVDGGELINEGFASTYVRNCLLSYETTFPQSELALYLNVMSTICS